MTTGNGSTLKYRVGELEKKYDKLDTKIDLIMTNHLPHLQQSMTELKTRINLLTALNVGALVLAVVAARYLG